MVVMEATYIVGTFILNNPGAVILLGFTGLVVAFWLSARKVGEGFDVE